MSALELPLPLSPRSRLASRPDLRRVLRFGGSIAVVAAVVVWALLLRPQFLAGPAAYVLVSGVSMEPTLRNGDLVVAHRRDSYRIGDVVVYRVPKGETGAGSLIIHRIVGGSAAKGWVVQGDNKDVPDLWRPRNTDVAGVMWASVPGAGTVLARGMSPFGLASISTLLAAFLGLPAAVMTAVDSRSRRRLGSRERMAALPSVQTGRALPSPPRLLAL